MEAASTAVQKYPHTATPSLPHQHAPPESTSSPMSTKGCQAQAPAAGGGNRAPTAGSQPQPRRGQIKERIIKDALAGMAAGLVVRADKNGGGGGLPVAADTDADGK